MSVSPAAEAPPSTVRRQPRRHILPDSGASAALRPVQPGAAPADGGLRCLAAAGKLRDIRDLLRHVGGRCHAVMPRQPVGPERHLRDGHAVQLEEVVPQHLRALRRGRHRVGLGVHQGEGGDQRLAAVPRHAVPLDTGARVVPAHRAVVVQQQRQPADLPADGGRGAVGCRQRLRGIDRAVVVVPAVHRHGAGHGGHTAALIRAQIVVRDAHRVRRQRQRGAEQIGARRRRGGGCGVCGAVHGAVRLARPPWLCQQQGGGDAQAGRQHAPPQGGAPCRQGTLGLLQQLVVDGVHHHAQHRLVHSIPSFSRHCRNRWRVRNREDLIFSSPAPHASAISRMLSPYQ